MINLSGKIKTLTVFNNLLNDKVIASFTKAVEEKSILEYSKFVNSIYENGANLSLYILDIALNDENIFLRTSIKREEIPVCVSLSLLRELKILKELSDYDTHEIDFITEYMKKIKDINSKAR